MSMLIKKFFSTPEYSIYVDTALLLLRVVAATSR